MNKFDPISRRRFLIGSGAAVGGLMLPGCGKTPLPPTYGNILRMSDNLTYLAHRTLLPGQSPVRGITTFIIGATSMRRWTRPCKR